MSDEPLYSDTFSLENSADIHAALDMILEWSEGGITYGSPGDPFFEDWIRELPDECLFSDQHLAMAALFASGTPGVGRWGSDPVRRLGYHLNKAWSDVLEKERMLRSPENSRR